MTETVSEFTIGQSRVRLYRQDCIAGMRQHLADENVDVVITSPPYNIGVKYSAYDDTIPRDAYFQWLDEWAIEIFRILKGNGSFFLNVGSKPSDPWLAMDVAQLMRKHFRLQNVIHWIKSITIEKKDVGDYGAIVADASVGHFKPIQSKRYLNDCHEYLFHFTKSGDVEIDRRAIGAAYQDKTNIKRWSLGVDRRCRGNNWFVPYKTIKSRSNDRPHPATFPVELASKAIRLHGVRSGLLVCDPYLGIGHAGLAALECGVDFIGFEIDEEYFAVAQNVLRQSADGQQELGL